MMQAFMCFTLTPKDLISEKPLRMQDFICLALAFGKSNPWCLAEVLTSDSTSLFSTVGKKGKHRWYTGRKETTVWGFDKPKKNGDHLTMKPIPLLAYQIMNSSMSNTIVLDPFGGSGSTLIACEQSDRSCYMIELDEKFYDVIIKRYIEQVGTSEKISVIRDGLTYKYTEFMI